MHHQEDHQVKASSSNVSGRVTVGNLSLIQQMFNTKHSRALWWINKQRKLHKLASFFFLKQLACF